MSPRRNAVVSAVVKHPLHHLLHAGPLHQRRLPRSYRSHRRMPQRQPKDLISFVTSQVDYILGANPKNMSYIYPVQVHQICPRRRP
ncbi:hypothetical protein GW17_00029022 [Ensete ventricosum]|nr:hypothetical protein GW17_00029022 [Ensete ventricosum]